MYNNQTDVFRDWLLYIKTSCWFFYIKFPDFDHRYAFKLHYNARVCVVQMFDFTHPIIYYLLYVKFDLDLAHATLSALFNCPGQLNR